MVVGREQLGKSYPYSFLFVILSELINFRFVWFDLGCWKINTKIMCCSRKSWYKLVKRGQEPIKVGQKLAGNKAIRKRDWGKEESRYKLGFDPRLRFESRSWFLNLNLGRLQTLNLSLHRLQTQTGTRSRFEGTCNNRVAQSNIQVFSLVRRLVQPNPIVQGFLIVTSHPTRTKHSLQGCKNLSLTDSF